MEIFNPDNVPASALGVSWRFCYIGEMLPDDWEYWLAGLWLKPMSGTARLRIDKDMTSTRRTRAPIPWELRANHLQAQVERIRIGFDFPITPQRYGRIYFDDIHIGNCFQYEDIPENENLAGKCVFNRDGRAFELGLPNNIPMFDNYEQMIDWLRLYVKENLDKVDIYNLAIKQ